MAKDMYIGVNNVAQKVKKAYVGVNGVAKEVKKIYVGVNGVARNVYSSGLNPDDYFDPITHIATEANFIAFLEAGGKYDSSMIGYKVQLNNTAKVDPYSSITVYNKGIWVIADVNHDSENTGQTNCYDLITEDCAIAIEGSYAMGGYGNGWRDTYMRQKFNDYYYEGFSSNFKSHIMNIKYKSMYSWYDDDKIILPSFKEVKGDIIDGESSSYDEGVGYPIFTDKNSRKKYIDNTSNYGKWWLRTPYYSDYWYIRNNGNIDVESNNNYYFHFTLLMRVS